MFGRGKKNDPILHQPQVWNGNECLVIGNWSAH
jgi:anti-sigma factor ChrR (cupin superfamily)